MGNFNKFGGDRGGRSFGGKGFGGGQKFGGHTGGPRQMHQATCSKCGQDCEVPFRPTGERPVFCGNCFKSQGGPPVNRFGPKSFGGASVHSSSQGGLSKEQFAALSVKLDKIISLLAIAKPVKTETVINEVVVEEKKNKEISKKTKAPAKKSKSKKK